VWRLLALAGAVDGQRCHAAAQDAGDDRTREWHFQPLAGRIEVRQGFGVGRDCQLPQAAVEGWILEPKELPE
jgi:hypothetical protein